MCSRVEQVFVVRATLLYDGAGHDVDGELLREDTKVFDPMSLIRSEMKMICDDS